jgi:porphobilinogen synthase
MLFPDYRPRRLRQSEAFRRMIRETRLTVDDLILPLFVIQGRNVRNPIESMPGHFQLSVDQLTKTATDAKNLGIPAVMLFGLPDAKDPLGTRGIRC